MSQRTVDIARSWVDAYNARDIERVLALTDPVIAFKSAFAGIESGGHFEGHDGVVAYFAALDEAYTRFTLAYREFIDAGAAAVMVADAEWCGRESGAQASTPIFPAMWVKGARILHVETLTDKAAALDAVGLTG